MCCLYKTVDLFYQCKYFFVHIIFFKCFWHSFWYLNVYFSSSCAYKNTVSISIVSESHFFINHIGSMTHSVLSVTNGEYFFVNSTPVFWVLPGATRRSLNQTSLFFLNAYFESIRCLFGGIFLLLYFLHNPLFIMYLNSFLMDVSQP